MLRVDPLALARRQWKRDRKRMRGHPHLLDHKIARMTASPFAFLRGTAPMFYELLGEHEALRKGPPGVGWIAGDLHMENFGAFRPGVLVAEEPEGRRRDHDDHVSFNLNDFDDTLVAPWRWDVLRLTTSLILAGRELGADGRTTIQLARDMVRSYVDAVSGDGATPDVPAPVAALVDKVRVRSHAQLLDARTKIHSGVRCLVRGPRYCDLDASTAAKARKAFARYVRDLPRKLKRHPQSFDVLDVAFRIAGTGSLGCLWVAVVVRGKGTTDGAWLFDMKEETAPSAGAIVEAPEGSPALRVMHGLVACLERPPQMIGQTQLRGRSMFVRRLAPQEDKLDLTTIPSADMAPLACYLGALAGRAHARGATAAADRPWTDGEKNTLLEKAIALAGLHEATYLAYCKLGA